jgi:Spy/CpxP family protein refolding chaperone
MKYFKWMGNWIFLMGSVFLLACLVLAYGFKAPPPAKAPMAVRHSRKSEILKRLKLTENQRDRIRQWGETYREKSAESDAQFMLERVDLESEMEKANPNMRRLDFLCERIGRLKGLKLREKIGADMELEREILTPQQLDQLRDIQEINQVWTMGNHPGNPG